MDNLIYSSDYIVNLFDNYRNKLEDFYPSEKWAFEKINSLANGFGEILDVGCGTGGLGRALSTHYNVKKYDGIDINKQAIEKATNFGFNLKGSAMASDAFFPFPDCVEIAHKSGINSVIQPGGSIKDQLSIDYCNENNVSMIMTGTRHFKH